MPGPAVSDIARAHHAFRRARWRLAQAVRSDDPKAIGDACGRLLRAYDRLHQVPMRLRRRDVRTAERWRGYALAAMHLRIPAGLAHRAHRLAHPPAGPTPPVQPRQ
jgi:hypothetical protein